MRYGQRLKRPAGRAGKPVTALLLPLLAALLALQTGCRAEEQWPLWQHYRDHFLDASGRIVDRTAGDRTTSEGQAYGMFFALVVNDRKTFEQMLRWTENNLAGGDLTSRLPVWNWGNNGTGEWKPLDANSAADADLWIAYDCLEAGRLWHDDRLTKLGTVIAQHIEHSEVVTVPGIGTVLLPAAKGFHPGPNQWVLNPSYMPPQVIARVRQEIGDDTWEGLLGSLPGVLGKESSAGFAMDWILADLTGLHPSSPPDVVAHGGMGTPAAGGYEAIRVYLWLGIADPATPGVREGLAALPGMVKYLATATTPPELVNSNGTVLSPNSPVGFSGAVYPFLMVLGQKQEAREQMDRVEANLDAASGLYGHTAAYYDQNLILFATGWKEGRFRFDADGRLRLKWR